MKILKKVLHLNYNEPKGEKQVVKSYNFEVAPTAEDTVLKEVGEELKKLISKTLKILSQAQKNHYNFRREYNYGKKIKYLLYN